MRESCVRPSARWVRYLVVFALLAAYLPAAMPAAAIVESTTIHVNVATGDDMTGDGTAEAPFMTITRGMDEAESGDTVLVAPGEYTPDNEMLPIMLKSGVTLKSSDGAAETVIDGYWYEGVLSCIEISDVTVEGFTIARGAAEIGGAIFLGGAEDITLRGLEMTENIALGGCGVGAMASTYSVEDCVFGNNGWLPTEIEPESLPDSMQKAAEPGAPVMAMLGGAVWSDECTATIARSDFVDNAAGIIGGGLCLFGGKATIEDARFERNIVSGDAQVGSIASASPAMAKVAQLEGEGYGGGLGMIEAEATVKSAEFIANEAFFGAGMHADPYSTFSVTDSVFADNFAFAGALSSFNLGMSETSLAGEGSVVAGGEMPQQVVDRCVFDSNEGLPVSAIASILTPLKVQNSLFAGNLDGGAVVWFQDEAAKLVNSTVAGNTSVMFVAGPATVFNSIIWGNEINEMGPTGMSPKDGETPKAFAAVTEVPGELNGCAVTYTDSQFDLEGTGNISADPKFANPEGGDFRLTAGSPAIDAGTFSGAPPYDLDALARPVDGDGDGAEEFDMGAYEFGLVERLGGVDRYKTAVQISQSRFDSANTVVIATGRVFADGLTGAGLAGALDAPLLLTTPGGLPFAVAQEVDRLGATKAIVLGGDEAVSGGVVSDLKALGLSVERIGGFDRYETAAMIAFRIFELTGEDFSGIVFVARGDTFPDALSVSPAAYELAAPIVLVMPDEMPASTIDVIDLFADADMFVAGGTKAVSTKVAEEIPDVKARIGGADRYATAAAFSRYSASQGWTSFDSVGIATGQDFADALAGGVAMGHDAGVLLLTPRDSLHAQTESALVDNAGVVSSVDIFGGAAAVSDNVRLAITDALD